MELDAVNIQRIEIDHSGIFAFKKGGLVSSDAGGFAEALCSGFGRWSAARRDRLRAVLHNSSVTVSGLSDGTSLRTAEQVTSNRTPPRRGSP